MSQISLRDRKYAKTKSELMQAVVSRLKAQTLEEINVKDVCDEVQVSETTFFNYFPSKNDVIVYFVQLWSIDASWSMRRCLQDGGTHLDAIRTLFDRTVDSEVESPGVMAEVVAHQAKSRSKFLFQPLTPAEYVQHFSGLSGIEEIEGQGIESLLAEQIVAAIQNNEIPASIDQETLGLTLMSIFFATPTLVKFGKQDLRQAYHKQLDHVLMR